MIQCCCLNVCDGENSQDRGNGEYYHIERLDYFAYPENDTDNLSCPEKYPGFTTLNLKYLEGIHACLDFANIQQVM